MRRVLVAVIVFVAYAVIGLGADDWPVKKYAAYVTLIESETRYCSSVLVGANGLYLTAEHCIATSEEAGETLKTPANGFPVKVLDRDSVADLAVFQALPLGTVVKVAKKEPKPGEQVLSLGYGNHAKILTGMPGWWIGEVDENVVVHSGVSLPGMSGGPVLNRHGELVALVEASVVFPSHGSVSAVTRLSAIQAAVKKYAK